ncbi:hypothetical protein GCM10009828_008670 [Actinoplanes couchii]|uniref:Uncharacterized protein n=1 Tax=Actinoplanes couchii TaxID=403638 RepID=A0ABQ3XII9_9ACTN|nr:hypothetical protein Aco03nite_067120 [Actinoplanes couchii]
MPDPVPSMVCRCALRGLSRRKTEIRPDEPLLLVHRDDLIRRGGIEQIDDLERFPGSGPAALGEYVSLPTVRELPQLPRSSAPLGSTAAAQRLPSGPYLGQRNQKVVTDGKAERLAPGHRSDPTRSTEPINRLQKPPLNHWHPLSTQCQSITRGTGCLGRQSAHRGIVGDDSPGEDCQHRYQGEIARHLFEAGGGPSSRTDRLPR